MNENIPKKGERKSLFSIQVDDLIIQRIFKTLEDEICKIRIDITDIQTKVSEKAEKNDLVALKMDVREFKEKSTLFKDKIETDLFSFQQDLNTTIAETKTYVRDQINEATVSLNGVVRAQNAIIEERIFQLSRPDSEIAHIIADFERVKRSNTVLSDKLSNIESFFSSFLNNTRDSSKTLPEIISHYFDPEREKIRNIEHHQKQSDERIKICEENINQIVGSDEITFPVAVKAEKHPFDQKPKLPPLPTAKSYTDYFEYMMTAFPALQKILSSFYHQVVGLSNSVYDQAERETSQEDLEMALQNLTDIIADVRELKESQDKLDSLSSKLEEVNSSKPIMDDMLNEIKKLKEVTISRAEVDEEIKKAVSDVVKQIQLLKMESSFKNESHQVPKPNKTITGRRSLPNTLLMVNSKNESDQQQINAILSSPKTEAASSAPIPQQQSPSSPTTKESNENSKLLLPQQSPSSTQQPPPPDEETATKEKVITANNSATSSTIASPSGSANHRLKGSSAGQSPRIMKPSVNVASSAASTASVPEQVITAVQPRGRAAHRMIFGDTSGSRPSSAASSTASSRISTLSNLSLLRAEDIEEGGRVPKRTQKTATPVIMSTDGLPEEKDDSLDFFNIL